MGLASITHDFTEQGAAPMRDLIDRAELLKFMRGIYDDAAKEGVSQSFLTAYMLAIRDVQIAPRVEKSDA